MGPWGRGPTGLSLVVGGAAACCRWAWIHDTRLPWEAARRIFLDGGQAPIMASLLRRSMVVIVPKRWCPTDQMEVAKEFFDGRDPQEVMLTVVARKGWPFFVRPGGKTEKEQCLEAAGNIPKACNRCALLMHF